ncbi:5'-nucleotidase C-terminal domain-containing protein, partial [Pseudomonadales bacterium]|nr:5'-nucleotidase C-terminal domain-containing protein [Pseudomonadales bacterium]
HEDPYFQQGGDMVRSGGLSYQMNPTAEAGARITNLRLSGGELIDASREYRVAGWATTGSASTGAPVWDLVANYLRGSDTARINRLETPDLIGVRANTGIEDYAGQLL